MSEEIAKLLGNIEGKLDMVISNQDKHEKKMDGMDGRLRGVESRSAIIGAGAASIVSIAVALAIEKGKKTIGLM